MARKPTSTAASRPAGAWPAWLAAFAAAGMAYYLAAGLALHVLRPDYPALQSGMSLYAVGPFGWLETAAFVFDGASLAALAVALWRGIAPQGRSRAGLALLGLVAVGRILEAALPTDVPPGPVPRTPVGVGHFCAALVVFIAITAAVLLVSRRFGDDAAMRPLAPTARALALACLVALVAFFGDTLAVGLFRSAPVDLNVAGLIEKLFLALWHAWALLVALRLRHVAGAAGLPAAA